jgi:hypothetical protein
MYVLRNREARWYKHCYREEAISIACSESVFVALGIQHAMHKRYIILSSVACLSGCNMYLHIISETAKFSEKKVIERKVLCFDLTYNIYLKHFSL